jgi:hypothetical protein
MDDGCGGRNKRQGRTQHFIARTDTECLERQKQRCRAIGDDDGIRRSANGGESFLKLGCSRTSGYPFGVDGIENADSPFIKIEFRQSGDPHEFCERDSPLRESRCLPVRSHRDVNILPVDVVSYPTTRLLSASNAAQDRENRI